MIIPETPALAWIEKGCCMACIQRALSRLPYPRKASNPNSTTPNTANANCADRDVGSMAGIGSGFVPGSIAGAHSIKLAQPRHSNPSS